MAEKLVDMKLTKADRGTVGEAAIEQPDFPFGLRLRLENAELKKLDMQSLPDIGAEFRIAAVGKVTDISESQSEGNRGDRSVSIQIIKLNLS